MWKLVPALVRQMGAGLSRTGARRGADRPRRCAGGDALQADARPRPAPARRRGGAAAGRQAAGEIAFKLYDTFGFPLDLTQDALRGRGLAVDTAGFETAMARQRAPRRGPPGPAPARRPTEVWFDLRERVGATEFLGYDTETAEGGRRAAGRRPGSRARPRPAQAPRSSSTRRRSTPNRAARSATPALFTAAGAEIAVTDTVKRAGALFVHAGQVTRGRIAVGDVVELRVDGERRGPPARQPLGHPPAARRRCAAGSASTSPRRARWWRPTACASTSATPSRCRPRTWPRSRPR
jgi:alanyl-tRNA synthetase